MKSWFFARPLAHHTLGVFSLITLLVLSGCGGDASETETAPTSTLVVTLPVPTATPIPDEPTATPEPVATTDASPAGATEEVTATQEISETAEITDSEGVTATEEVTITEEVTASEDVTATEEVTATHEMSAGHDMTTTEEISPSTEITSSAAISGVEAASDARVFFLQPTSNAVVPITFTVVMSYTGVTLAAAADGMAGAGHMHILIDSDFIEVGQVVPKDDLHLHFGDGATTTELSLVPGSHILRLQFADNNHIALEGDQFRQEIIVNVVDGAPEQAVRIASPTSGATVPPSFNVVMAATGLKVEPAGAVSEGAGHFHLLIDEPYVAAGDIIPTDDTHIHFGKAQLTTTLTLEPGTHEVRLQFADGTHHALAGNQYRAEVQVIVAEDADADQVMFVKPARWCHCYIPLPRRLGGEWLDY